MNPKSQSCRVALLANQVGPATSATDLVMALNEYTDIEGVLISLKKPSGIPGEIPVVYPSDEGSSSQLTISTIQWLNGIIREYDIVTSVHTYAGLLGAIIAKYHGKKILAREGNNHKKFPFKIRAARSVTGLLSDRIVCVSQSVANSFSGFERIVPNSKFEVITNGVDIDEIQSAKTCDWSIHSTIQIDSESSIIGTAGMLIKQKNHETLIKAINHIKNNCSMKVELVIAGAGPRREYLQNLAQGLGVETEVHFLGYLERNRVYKMLHEIDCYAMPSRWEGFSAAVLQAMAAEVPCVLSKIPSFISQYPESVAKFHEVDSESDLAESLYATLQHDSGMGKRGYEFVAENHSIKVMASEYADLYCNLFKN